mgnify:FL=1
MNLVFCSSAVIRNKKDQILIMSRKNKKTLRNCWEFPGGKLSNFEDYFDALIRELKEELGIDTTKNKFKNYIFTRHQYRAFLLMMYTFEVKHWRGQMENKDNETLRWVSIKEIKKIKLLPANTKVINYFLK